MTAYPNLSEWAAGSPLASGRILHGVLLTFVKFHALQFGSSGTCVKVLCLPVDLLDIGLFDLQRNMEDERFTVQSFTSHLQMREHVVLLQAREPQYFQVWVTHPLRQELCVGNTGGVVRRTKSSSASP